MSEQIRLTVTDDGTYDLGTNLTIPQTVQTLRGILDDLAADRSE